MHIQQTEGWRKAVEAAMAVNIDCLQGFKFGDDFVVRDLCRAPSEQEVYRAPYATFGRSEGVIERIIFERRLAAALPHILAALAESAEPLTEESDEFPAIDAAFKHACGPGVQFPPRYAVIAAANASRAPLLARIQALAETNAQHKAAHLEYYGKMLEAQRQRDAAIEALTQVEWRGIVFGEQCGECLRTQLEGHNPTCTVGNVLHPFQPAPETTND